MRVLIADRDELFVESLQFYLLRNGHVAKAAFNAIDCADILTDFTPDVVILDCGLLWGGYQGVVTLIGETPRLSRTLTVLIGDEDPRDDFNGSLDPLRLAWLSKPFRLSDLLTSMEAGSPALRSTSQARGVKSLVSQHGGVQ